MQYGSELDMQEIEYQLYNQVYHSYVDWDKDTRIISNENLNSQRHVSTFSVNNTCPPKPRYWREGEDNNNDNTDHIATLNPSGDNKSVPHGRYFKKEKYKRRDRRKASRKKQQNEHRFAQTLNQNQQTSELQQLQIVPYNKLETVRAQTENFEQKMKSPHNVNVDIVILTDSDSDSVEEVPLPTPPPIPTYILDTSDEEQEQQISTTKAVKSQVAPKTEPSNNGSEIQLEAQACLTESVTHSQQTCLENVGQTSRDITLNLVKDRREHVETPDSVANDFIQRDLEHFQDNQRFTFNLQEYDLGNVDSEYLRPIVKVPMAPPSDLYETESSCSEIGNTHDSSTVFRDVIFESHAKEIFSEPDLSSFSHFITPNRSIVRGPNIPNDSQVGKIQCATEVDDDKNDSETNEYDSDPTVLNVKKKRKRRNGKKKRRVDEKRENSVSINSIETEQNKEKDEIEVVRNREIIENKEINESKTLKDKEIVKEFNTNGSETINTQDTTQGVGEAIQVANDKKIPDLSMEFIDDQDEININLNSSLETNNEFIDVCTTNIEMTATTETTLTTSHQFSFLKVFKDLCKQQTVQVNESKCEERQHLADDSENEIDVGVEIDFNQMQKVVDERIIVLSDSDDGFETNMVKEKMLMTPDTKLENDLILNTFEKPLGNTSYKSSDVLDSGVNATEIQKTNAEKHFEKNTESISDKNKCSKSKNKRSKRKKLVKNPFNTNKGKLFSDFWTTDMRKFYDDSWGQENYDMQKEIANMSSDPSKWKIIPEDIYKSSPKKSGPRCVRCKEYGHARYECPKISGQKCSLCGKAGHFHARCPNLMCTTCGKKEGYHTTSCGNCFNYGNINCSLCQMRGHIDRNCPDLWRRYHITKNSNEPHVSKLKVKAIEERWCSGCAKRGHFQHECRQSSSEHFRTLPYVVNYGPSYDTVQHFSQMEPEPVLPTFQDVPLHGLRNYKNTLIVKNAARYKNMLRNLRSRCQKYDSSLLHHVESLQRDLRNNRFDCKKVKMLYKLQNRLKKCM